MGRQVICVDDECGGEDHPGSPYHALSDRSSIGPNKNQTRVVDLEDENLQQISRGGWPVKGLRSRHQ